MKKSGQWATAGLLTCWSLLNSGLVSQTALAADPPPDKIRPRASIAAPASNESILISNFNAGSVNGTAFDNVGVTGTEVTLSRQTSGGVQYWTLNGWSSTKAGDVGGSITPFGGKSVTWSWNSALPPASELSPGRYKLEVAAFDAVGRGNYATRGFYLAAERIPPHIAISSPGANARLLGKDFLAGGIQGTAGDDSGLDRVTVKLFRVISGQKSYFDGTGWGSQTAEIPCLLGLSADKKSASWQAVALPFPNTLTPGSYYVQAFATDDSGNIATRTRVITIVGDNHRPSVAITSPVSRFVLPQEFHANTVGGTASDNNSVSMIAVRFFRTRSGNKEYWGPGGWTSDRTYAPITGTGFNSKSATWNLIPPPLSVLGTGTYTVWAQATDDVGNTSEPMSRSFLIVGENVPPTVRISTPAASSRYLAADFNVAVTGTATDNSALEKVTARFSRVIDTSKSFWGGSNWGSKAVDLPCTEVFTPDFRSLTWTLASAPPPATLAGGNYYIQATATDTSGNTASVTCPFTIVSDSTNPVVSITKPFARQVVNAKDFDFDTVQGAASDNVGVTDVIVKFSRTRSGVKEYWNGSAWVTESASTFVTTGYLDGKAISWKMIPPGETALDSGLYDLWVQAKDLVGNASAPSVRSFVVNADPSSVDTQKPNATINKPASPVLAGEFSSDTVTGTATDNKAVILVTVKFYRIRAGIKEYWSSGGWTTHSVPAPIHTSDPLDGSVTWNLESLGAADLDNGTYSVWVQAEDAAGNLSDPVATSFEVTKTGSATKITSGQQF